MVHTCISSFWATVCKTVRPVLSDRCLSVQSVCLTCPVCNVGVLWPNGWMDQDETWHADRPRPWPHCVTWWPSSPSPKGTQPPFFGPYVLWPNGWMDQDATWQGGRPWPKWHCVRWGPSSPLPERGQSPPQFSAHVYCGQTAGWIKMPLGTKVSLSPGNNVFDADPAPPPKWQSPQF